MLSVIKKKDMIPKYTIENKTGVAEGVNRKNAGIITEASVNKKM